MNDMSAVIIAKSDQLNADSFIAGPQTFTIREVQIRGGQEQPVNILLDDTDLAYRPCKSMSRVLVQAWGPDANRYVGRSLTLYRDPTVKWGGMEVGGIRISHMSHIDGKMQMALTATKGQRKPHIVMPLVIDQKPAQRQTTAGPLKAASAEEWAALYKSRIDAMPDLASLETLASVNAKWFGNLPDDLRNDCANSYEARVGALAREGRDDTDMGDGFADDAPQSF